MQNPIAQTSVLTKQISSQVSRNARWTAERCFYCGITLFFTAGLLLGFARTFFLRPWFQEWAQAHGATEPFFLLHGVVFVAWFALLFVQTSLIATGRVNVHRRLGWLGAGLSVLMVTVGIIGALIAAGRPTGFIDIPVPPLQCLTVPIANSLLFGAFFVFAIIKRRKPQSHKRFILIATIFLLEAAVARWPFPFMTVSLPVPGYTMTELCTDLFLVPIIVWDISTQGRLHPVTLWGGLVLIASQFVRFIVSGTAIWLALAAWAVGLLG